MSLILEALRKSEAERRRDSAPDVALELPPAPVRAARTAPSWLWPALAAVVALAALGGWLGSRLGDRDGAAPAPTPIVQTTPASAGMPRVVPRPEAVSPPATSPASEESAAASPPARADAQAPAPSATTDTAPMPQPMPQPASATPPPAAPSADAPDIAATALAPVKLSMHMWDADPARRFVILDGQRMGEGDRSGGLSVIAIDRKGVTVERDGQRAHVPLP